MIWGYTAFGARKHVLAEELSENSRNAGISLCGIVLRFRIDNEEYRPSWVMCDKCQTLLSAMESV